MKLFGAVLFGLLFLVASGLVYEIRHERRFPWITIRVSAALFGSAAFVVWLFT
jgi:hypothetical protein